MPRKYITKEQADHLFGPKAKILEKDIEKRVCEYAKSKGLLVYKFTSPARSSVPDRLFILPSGKVYFIEFKRTGEVATPQQEREHVRIRGHGVPVFVVDNVSAGYAVIDFMVNR